MTLKEISLEFKDLQHGHGYTPDKQERAGLVEIEQAEWVCKDWV
ncbi:hypothetical protein [Corallococcus exercitus]|nr:hypothetical protein [Corallococcus exercitus]